MSFLCGKFKEKTKTKIQTLIISDFCTVTSYKLKKKTLELLQAHLCDLILSFNFFILITLQNITNHFYARLTVILKTRFCFVYAGFWERNSWLQIAPNIWLGTFFLFQLPLLMQNSRDLFCCFANLCTTTLQQCTQSICFKYGVFFVVVFKIYFLYFPYIVQCRGVDRKAGRGWGDDLQQMPLIPVSYSSTFPVMNLFSHYHRGLSEDKT